MSVHLRQTFRHRSHLVALVFASTAAALVLVGPARAIDTDGNGYHDALLREIPYLPYANVGAKCEMYLSNGTYRARLSVRPPRVWSLWNQYNQTVAWRARFVNPSTGRTEGESPLSFSTASPNQYTDFGGGPNAPQVFISWSQYWTNSKWIDHPVDTTPTVKAVVDVLWLDARTGLWTGRTLSVAYYYISGTNVVQPSTAISGC